MKRPRESVDDEHQVDEPVPEHLPSPEPAHQDSPPAKRRRTSSRASIARVPSPKPVQSRVRARQPARKGKVAAPAAIQIAGRSMEVAGKGSGKGQTFTDRADTSKETDKTDKRGTSEEVNTEGVNSVPADGKGHSSEEGTPGRTPNKVVENDAAHDGDVEPETEAGKKPLQQKASKKGEQINMLSKLTLTSS